MRKNRQIFKIIKLTTGPGVNVMITIFCDFRQLSVKILAFFSKTNVMIKILHNLAMFWVKNANFFAEFVGENFIKIITGRNAISEFRKKIPSFPDVSQKSSDAAISLSKLLLVSASKTGTGYNIFLSKSDMWYKKCRTKQCRTQKCRTKKWKTKKM
jgi:hypothetical protein